MKLTDKEINALLSKSQDVRYSYSLKRIADNDCLWTLTAKEGNFLSIQSEGLNMFPVWPFKEYVEKYISALGIDENYMAIVLSLEKFADELVDSLCENGMAICVFPISEKDKGKIISINTFAEDLAVELENYC